MLSVGNSAAKAITALQLIFQDSRFYFENNSTTQLQEYYYMNESQAEYITLRYIDK